MNQPPGFDYQRGELVTNIRFSFHDHDIFLIKSKDDTFLLYAPTLRCLLRIAGSLARRIGENELSHPCTDTAINRVHNLLNKSLANAIKPFPVHLRKSTFFHMALGLTKDCTLRCLYCHADAGGNYHMSSNILEQSIQFAFESAKQNKLKGINVSFAVGGEPTMDWNLFTQCVNRLEQAEEKYSVPIHLSMTTNGYYGQVKRRFIAEHLDSVLLSFDGPVDIQNLHRPALGGKPSYPLVLQSARFFLQNVQSFAIRSTVSNYSVQRMPEIVEFFLKQFGNKYDLIFEPLVPLGRAIRNAHLVSEPSQEEFVTYYIQSKELAKKNGLEIKTSAANHKRLVTSFCGAMSIPSFTVTTTGTITTCERDSTGENYGYGRFDPDTQTFVFDEQRIHDNISLLSLPQKCNNCFCKWHCAGDCPDLRTINYDRCYVNRRLVQYELESTLNTANKTQTRKEVI